MGVSFEKYEGLGNDFVVIDATSEQALSKEEVSRLCDRHLGIGADGVLLVLPPQDAQAVARMVVLNADGSVPEMCGNGLRCVALRLHRRGLGTDFLVETAAGPKRCRVDGETELVTVEMGAVRVVRDVALRVGGEILRVVEVDVGNPHAVTFDRVGREAAERIGPALATHVEFPKGANAGFASVEEGSLRLWVWERGVGLTRACGTGACAAAAAALSTNRIPRGEAVSVHLPGGTLVIRETTPDQFEMTGPARRVYVGTLS